MTVKLWETDTGRELQSKSFDGPARYCEFSIGEKMLVVTSDPFMGFEPLIQIMMVDRDTDTSAYEYETPLDEVSNAVRSVSDDQMRDVLC